MGKYEAHGATVSMIEKLIDTTEKCRQEQEEVSCSVNHKIDCSCMGLEMGSLGHQISTSLGNHAGTPRANIYAMGKCGSSKGLLIDCLVNHGLQV